VPGLEVFNPLKLKEFLEPSLGKKIYNGKFLTNYQNM
jgi:hypothetical protein